MVKALKGALLTCDPAVKQLILSLNEQAVALAPNNAFLIQDLDETHLLVKADRVDSIREELAIEVRVARTRPSHPDLTHAQLEQHTWSLETQDRR